MCRGSGIGCDDLFMKIQPLYLMLVNRTHPFDEKRLEEIELVPVRNIAGDEVLLEKKTAEAFAKMREDMKEQGLILEIEDGYRSREEQIRVMKHIAAEEGEEAAAARCAPPGCSEHETGLAIDIIYDLIFGPLVMRWNPVFSEYGFIERYPEGKEEITGYIPESWHLRYVGPEHSVPIEQQRVTLEEYLAQLEKKEAES